MTQSWMEALRAFNVQFNEKQQEEEQQGQQDIL